MGQPWPWVTGIAMLDSAAIDVVKDYRHRMRLAGCWGACFEVSCFIEQAYCYRRVDGVYQLPCGTPVFKHSWNSASDGTIIDATADQFFHDHDVAIHAPAARPATPIENGTPAPIIRGAATGWPRGHTSACPTTSSGTGDTRSGNSVRAGGLPTTATTCCG